MAAGGRRGAAAADADERGARWESDDVDVAMYALVDRGVPWDDEAERAAPPPEAYTLEGPRTWVLFSGHDLYGSGDNDRGLSGLDNLVMWVTSVNAVRRVLHGFTIEVAADPRKGTTFGDRPWDWRPVAYRFAHMPPDCVSVTVVWRSVHLPEGATLELLPERPWERVEVVFGDTPAAFPYGYRLSRRDAARRLMYGWDLVVRLMREIEGEPDGGGGGDGAHAASGGAGGAGATPTTRGAAAGKGPPPDAKPPAAEAKTKRDTDGWGAAGSLVPRFWRVGGDRNETYGDGGTSWLCYPAWVCPDMSSLGFAEEDRELLKRVFKGIAAERRDEHVTEPVSDIVDPNLMPIMLCGVDAPIRDVKALYAQQRIEDIEFDRNMGVERRDELSFLSRAKAERKDGGTGIDEHDVPAGTLKRSMYQWPATYFMIDASGRVRIDGFIHGLQPRSDFEAAYGALERLFEAFLPMLHKQGIITAGVACRRQVVVKSQLYALRPGMSYSGAWHCEGARPEHVQAACTYYIHCDDELKGGSLKFRPSSVPSEMYNIVHDVECATALGTGVCFSNVLPHRFRRLSNGTSRTLRRMFVNFFVCDPDKSLVPPRPLLSGAALARVLLELSRGSRASAAQTHRSHRGTVGAAASGCHGEDGDEDDGGAAGAAGAAAPSRAPTRVRLPEPARKLIAAFVGEGDWASIEEAKAFRQEVRDLLRDAKSGWGYMHFGVRAERAAPSQLPLTPACHTELRSHRVSPSGATWRRYDTGTVGGPTSRASQHGVRIVPLGWPMNNTHAKRTPCARGRAGCLSSLGRECLGAAQGDSPRRISNGSTAAMGPSPSSDGRDVTTPTIALHLSSTW